MEKGQLLTIVGISLIVAVLSSVLTVSITGRHSIGETVRANTCDLDSVCEIKDFLQGTKLTLKSDSGVTTVDGALRVAGQGSGAYFDTSRGNFTIVPFNGNLEVEGKTLALISSPPEFYPNGTLRYSSNVVFNLENNTGNLRIVSTNNIEMRPRAAYYVDSIGAVFTTLRRRTTAGPLRAYVCVDERGGIYRSTTSSCT